LDDFTTIRAIRYFGALWSHPAAVPQTATKYRRGALHKPACIVLSGGSARSLPDSLIRHAKASPCLAAPLKGEGNPLILNDNAMRLTGET
jgi:hypothetical protein